ncbi:fungal trichothecene efflux pump [Podospora conica]|nr:fungal trichothecene efflux pump [Schizothecium conicum]
MGSVETGSDGPSDIEKVTPQTGGQYTVKLDSEKPNATTRAESTPEIPLDGRATATSSLEAQDNDNAIRAHGSPLHRFLALAALACMWSSAQIPIFLFAGAPAYIYAELGGVDHWVWFVTANLLATAAIAPFVGALSDLAGRRQIALAGSATIVVGQLICSTAKTMDVFIGGMAITGVGTGINELTVLAGTAELVPLSKRGYYLASVSATMIPYIPSVLYAQVISYTSSWRYIGTITIGASLIALIMTFLFYSPPKPSRDSVQTKGEILKKLDYLGGFLATAGLAILEIGILGGGYPNPWTSPSVLAPLIIGILLLVLFGLWEALWAPNPMLPRRLGRAPRTLILTMIITFISGANFFSVLMIWPSQAWNVYGHDPIGVGIRGLPFALGTLTGCVVSLFLMPQIRGHIRWLILGSCIIMTAGCGGLAAARVDNIKTVYGILFVAGMGVGGIIIPASTVTTYICPSDLIATITSLTISIRIIGGAIGYAVYYNIFINKLIPELVKDVGTACFQSGITNITRIITIGEMTGHGLLEDMAMLPEFTDAIDGKAKYDYIVGVGQVAFANVYPWVYYCSIGFGAVSVIASLFLEDISEFIDETVVVVL